MMSLEPRVSLEKGWRLVGGGRVEVIVRESVERDGSFRGKVRFG